MLIDFNKAKEITVPGMNNGTEMCIRDRDFAVACMRANLRYEKNQKREDVKSHHYIISFDPRDGTDNGLTTDPVSYTHLDVYKRQLYYRLERISALRRSGNTPDRALCGNSDAAALVSRVPCLHRAGC